MKKIPIVDSIGLIAVFVGLVFVGLEIRQTNQLAQAAAFQEIGFQTAQNWYDASNDPDFNRVWLRHLFAEPDWWAKQDPRDVERLITLWVGYLRVYETLYLQTDLGLLDQAALDKLGWGGLRELPAVQYLWPHLRHAVGPSFAEHITEHWEEVPPLAPELFLEP